VKAQIKAEAAQAGGAAVEEATPCGALICEPNNFALWRGTRWTSFFVGPRGDGTRVEIAGSSERALVLTPLLANATLTEVRTRAYEPGWDDHLVTDFELSGEVESDPVARVGWRTNFIGQVGARLARWGQLGDDPRTSHSVSILAGPGIVASTTGPSLIAELTVSFDRQRLVEPIAGQRLAVGPRDALDISFAGRFLDNQQDQGATSVSRNGVEVALTARRVGLGGITMRAGYLWGPGGGKTLAIGVRALDSWRAYIAALGVGFVAGLVMGLTHPDAIMVSGG
jgi:hypothetical protein